MKVFIFATLFTLASAHDLHGHHARMLQKRQSSVSPTATAAGSSTTSATAATGVLTGIPPLSSITSGMPSQVTAPLTATYTAGQKPPISGAPPLPSPFVYNAADWPAQDKLPDTTTDQVAEWMKELDGFNIPDLDPTVDGTCVNDPTAANDAANRGWWTCGGYTRPTDIVACPDKLTWGLSFDDGPGLYTQTLLDYLSEKELLATFFVVGSRTIELPDILLEEYMSGHEISVHTWSHPALTKLTNIEIVAELGWTRKAIQTITGVTPVTMRPPYGDIDDRVRAIAMAMGMVPVIWTRGPTGNQFDTNDWEVPGGVVTGPESFQSFQYILDNATLIDTGFIVLEHDLFEQTVDLAVGYTLNTALAFSPKLTLEPIGQCQGWPASNLYLETTTNTTFPYPDTEAADQATTTAAARAAAASSSSASGGSGNSTSGSTSGASGLRAQLPGTQFLMAGAAALLGGLLFA